MLEGCDLVEDLCCARFLGEHRSLLCIDRGYHVVLHNHSEALASHGSKLDGCEVHIHAKGLGELPVAICNKVNLVAAPEELREGSHHEGVVHTHRHDLISTTLQDLIGTLDELGDLLGHACGGEGTWVTDQYDILVL